MTIGGGGGDDRSETNDEPDRHRLAVLTWLVVYPVLTALLYVGDPVVAPLPLPVRTLVLSGILVPFLVYVGMPVATRRFARWLRAGP